MTAYVTRAVLKERLDLKQLPIPTLDPDLDRLIVTASGMVDDRVTPFAPDPPSNGVQQVVLMLAVRLRTSEIGNYLDPNTGRPAIVPLWTQDLTDILGSQIADLTPGDPVGSNAVPVSGVMSRTAILPGPVGWPEATDAAYGGRPYPWRAPVRRT